MNAVWNKPQSSALKAPISQLPPRRFAAINPTTTVEEALSEAIALTLSVSSILGALTTSDEEHACLYALEIAAEMAGDLVDAALDSLREEGPAMNLANLISKQCSRDPSEVLTDEQAMSLWEREVARQAAQNMALGVAAVGKLLALTSAEGEIGQETAERLGWFLEEVGGAIFQLAEFEQVCSERINRQKEAQQ